MTIPTSHDVDLALHLEAVRANRPIRRTEMLEPVSQHFPSLTAEDRAQTRSDGRTKVFGNMVQWAFTHLKRRGILDHESSGEWRASANALDVLVDDLAHRGVPAQRARQFVAGSEPLPAVLGADWAKPARLKQVTSTNGRAARAPRRNDSGSTANIPSATGKDPDHLDRGSAKRKLLARLNAIDPYDFEQLVGRVLDSIGFRDTQVVGRSGDEGVDIITYLHSPLVRAKVAVQVKRRSGNVGPKDISYLRDRWARRSDRLLFVTTSDFTSGAREVADDEHDNPVALVPGDLLAEVMISHGLGVRALPQVTYEIDDDYLAGADPASADDR